MIKTPFIAAALSLTTLAVAFAQEPAKQSPTRIGEFDDWSTWSYTGPYAGNGNGKVCYIYAELQDEDDSAKKAPRGAMLPRTLKHGRVTFTITSSPAEGVMHEANFVAGYDFKDQAPVTVDIDGKKFTMFTQGDSAWLLNKGEEPELLEAMKSGKKMVVSAQSVKGNKTTYNYSLAGVTAAVDKMLSECK